MKLSKTLLLLPFLSSALLLNAQDKENSLSNNKPQETTSMADKAKSPLDYIEQNGKKFILVATLNSVETNTQFMRNVQILNSEKQALAQFNERVKIALTGAEKDALAEKIKEVTARLEKDNAEMVKAYGFSLAHNYAHAIVNTQILLKLTDEEYGKFKADEKTKPEDLIVRENDKFAIVARIPGVEENNVFRQNVQLVQVQRDRIAKMEEALKTMSASDEKTKFEEELKKAKEVLIKNNEDMTKRYGFSLTRNYVLEVEVSKLYMEVTEENFIKAEAAEREKAIKAAAEKKN